MKKTKLRVGSDWSHCPCCKVSYHDLSPHHDACPVGMSSVVCKFCGVAHNRDHLLGCPYAVGLFPILAPELAANLECGLCDDQFQEGDCFVAGKTALLCLGCGWVESAEQCGEAG